MPDIMRYYVVLRAPPVAVQRLYEKSSAEEIGVYIAEQVFQDERPKRIPFDVVALPSNDIGFLGEETPRKSAPEYFVASLAFRERHVLGALAGGVARNKVAFFGGGADIPFAGTEHWCPRDAPTFSD